MHRPGGYLIITDPALPPVERDTYTCGHCNAIVVVAPGEQPVRHCGVCDWHLCRRCAPVLRCRPFEQWMEYIERADRLRSM